MNLNFNTILGDELITGNEDPFLDIKFDTPEAVTMSLDYIRDEWLNDVYSSSHISNLGEKVIFPYINYLFFLNNIDDDVGELYFLTQPEHFFL